MLLMACGRGDDTREIRTPQSPTAGDRFTVMTYSLGQYGYLDRTGDGQAIDLKPEPERRAVLQMIAEQAPDILALQEIGNPHVFAQFREGLKAQGLDYRFSDMLYREGSESNLAILSRYPIVASELHEDDSYSMGREQVRVKRGFLDVKISITPSYGFRLIIADLKSKAYHPLGQTEMRRSEARLLGNRIRSALRNNPRVNLLVVGNMNDHIQSAPLRLLQGQRQQYLVDLKPADPYGEIWSYYDAEGEQYLRTSYMLASPYMTPEWIPDASAVIRSKLGKLASPHRPLFATFHAQDLPPDFEPPTPSYEDDDIL